MDWLSRYMGEKRERLGRWVVVAVVVVLLLQVVDWWQRAEFLVGKQRGFGAFAKSAMEIVASPWVRWPAFALAAAALVGLHFYDKRQRERAPRGVRLTAEGTVYKPEPGGERPSGVEIKYPSGRQDAIAMPDTVAIHAGTQGPGPPEETKGLGNWRACHEWPVEVFGLEDVVMLGVSSLDGEERRIHYCKVSGPGGEWVSDRNAGGGKDGFGLDIQPTNRDTRPFPSAQFRDPPKKLDDGSYEVEWRALEGVGARPIRLDRFTVKDGAVTDPIPCSDPGKLVFPAREDGYVTEYEMVGKVLRMAILNIGQVSLEAVIRCNVTNPNGVASYSDYKPSSTMAYVGHPEPEARMDYPTEFNVSRPLVDGVYRIRWKARPIHIIAPARLMRQDAIKIEGGRLVVG